MTESASQTSKVERVKYGKRESAKHLLTVNDIAIYKSMDGTLSFELFALDPILETPTEGYKLTLCEEDVARLKKELHS